MIGRNDLCPCGSGLKYKKCCLGKPDNPDYSDITKLPQTYKALREKARFKECIFPDHHNCSERIIKAHSIQNNKVLSRISDNGMVYMPCPKTELSFALQKEYGRKEASVFSGFCSFHDKTVFQPIEDRDFLGTSEQVFLFTYRAFALEYHKKQEAVRGYQAFFAQKPSIVNSEDWMKSKKMVDLSLADLKEEKKLFDEAIKSQSYDVLTSFVWEFDGFAHFAVSGGECPALDFCNKQLQNLSDPSVTAKYIYLSVFPQNSKTFAIISWFKAHDALFSTIKDRLDDTTDEEKRNYINNTIPMITENICIKPSAWDALPNNEKDEFGMLFLGLADLMENTGQKFDRFQKPSFDLFKL